MIKQTPFFNIEKGMKQLSQHRYNKQDGLKFLQRNPTPKRGTILAEFKKIVERHINLENENILNI